jgi:hypothetical protein
MNARRKRSHDRHQEGVQPQDPTEQPGRGFDGLRATGVRKIGLSSTVWRCAAEIGCVLHDAHPAALLDADCRRLGPALARPPRDCEGTRYQRHDGPMPRAGRLAPVMCGGDAPPLWRTPPTPRTTCELTTRMRVPFWSLGASSRTTLCHSWRHSCAALIATPCATPRPSPRRSSAYIEVP